MKSRTRLEYKNGDQHIVVSYFDEKPVFYIVECGDRDAMVTCGFRKINGEEGALALLTATETLLSDLSFMLEHLLPSIIRNAEDAFSEDEIGRVDSVAVSWGMQKDT